MGISHRIGMKTEPASFVGAHGAIAAWCERYLD